MTEPIRLAIYDMDRTVTRRATFFAFLVHAARRRSPWRLALLPIAVIATLAYFARAIDRAKLKQWNFTLLLGGRIAPATLLPIVESYAERVARSNVRPGALARIAADRADGYRLILATASYRLYVDAIAARLGFDAVIATNSILGLDARVSAKIDGENCYGPAKLRMIAVWLAAAGIDRAAAHIRFYSDHDSDAPAMRFADEAVAVNPGPAMRRLARREGWTLADWG